MTLSIKDPRADRMARELAKQTGQSITEVIVEALSMRLALEERRRAVNAHLLQEIEEIAIYCASLPIGDNRSDDEILGYDNQGIPIG